MKQEVKRRRKKSMADMPKVVDQQNSIKKTCNFLLTEITKMQYAPHNYFSSNSTVEDMFFNILKKNALKATCYDFLPLN